MQRALFYDSAKSKIGSLSNTAVQGFEMILDEAERRGTGLNKLAYMLATAWWETAKTMQPVREAFYIAPKSFEKAEKWRKANLHYYPYYGRGFVQLTWKANYAKASAKLGQDFVKNPDFVMEPSNAVKIMFDGMKEGWFTGKSLDDYIDDIDEPENEDLAEYANARKIINGKDKKDTIAAIAVDFETALKAGDYKAVAVAHMIDAVDVLTTGSSPDLSGFNAFIASLGLRHFKAYEFLEKGGQNANPNSPAYGLNTDPPHELWDNIAPTARILDMLREALGRPIVILSVYRSPAYNAAIGGAGSSAHMKFNAIDFAVLGSPVGPMQWAAPLRDIRNAGTFKGGIGIYATFVHLDTRGQNVDWTG